MGLSPRKISNTNFAQKKPFHEKYFVKFREWCFWLVFALWHHNSHFSWKDVGGRFSNLSLKFIKLALSLSKGHHFLENSEIQSYQARRSYATFRGG